MKMNAEIMKILANKSVLVLYLAVSFSACTLERSPYETSPEEILQVALSADYLASPDEAWEWISVAASRKGSRPG